MQITELAVQRLAFEMQPAHGQAQNGLAHHMLLIRKASTQV